MPVAPLCEWINRRAKRLNCKVQNVLRKITQVWLWGYRASLTCRWIPSCHWVERDRTSGSGQRWWHSGRVPGECPPPSVGQASPWTLLVSGQWPHLQTLQTTIIIQCAYILCTCCAAISHKQLSQSIISCSGWPLITSIRIQNDPHNNSNI